MNHRVRNILLMELAGFTILILATWLNELFDLPHYLFGISKTPINYEEAFFESAFILLLTLVVISVTKRLLKRIAQLEEILPICMFCKKIRSPDSDPEEQESWESVEMYIHGSTGTRFSHSICPECKKKHYDV